MKDVSFEYAKALFELSVDKKEREIVLYNLNSFIESLDHDTKNFFLHPEIKKEKKKEMISLVFEKGILRGFLYVLIDNNRFVYLEEIRNEYQELIDNDNNILDVYVYSSKNLDKSYQNSLKEKLEQKLKRNINLINEIDNKITAGIRIIYESKEIDLTLDSKFKKFKDEIKESLWRR